MEIEASLKKLQKLVSADPYAKSKLAAALGIASTSTIDKWLTAGKIPRLKKMAVLVAIKKLESKK